MPLADYVTVRLTMDNIRYQVLQAFSMQEVELKAQVEAALDEAIASFDLDKMIQAEVQIILKSEIRKIIEWAVEQEVRSILNQRNTYINQAVHEAVEKVIAERQYW